MAKYPYLNQRIRRPIPPQFHHFQFVNAHIAQVPTPPPPISTFVEDDNGNDHVNNTPIDTTTTTTTASIEASTSYQDVYVIEGKVVEYVPSHPETRIPETWIVEYECIPDDDGNDSDTHNEGNKGGNSCKEEKEEGMEFTFTEQIIESELLTAIAMLKYPTMKKISDSKIFGTTSSATATSATSATSTATATPELTSILQNEYTKMISYTNHQTQEIEHAMTNTISTKLLWKLLICSAVEFEFEYRIKKRLDELLLAADDDKKLKDTGKRNSKQLKGSPFATTATTTSSSSSSSSNDNTIDPHTNLPKWYTSHPTSYLGGQYKNTANANDVILKHEQEIQEKQNQHIQDCMGNVSNTPSCLAVRMRIGIQKACDYHFTSIGSGRGRGRGRGGKNKSSTTRLNYNPKKSDNYNATTITNTNTTGNEEVDMKLSPIRTSRRLKENDTIAAAAKTAITYTENDDSGVDDDDDDDHVKLPSLAEPGGYVALSLIKLLEEEEEEAKEKNERTGQAGEVLDDDSTDSTTKNNGSDNEEEEEEKVESDEEEVESDDEEADSDDDDDDSDESEDEEDEDTINPYYKPTKHELYSHLHYRLSKPSTTISPLEIQTSLCHGMTESINCYLPLLQPSAVWKDVHSLIQQKQPSLEDEEDIGFDNIDAHDKEGKNMKVNLECVSGDTLKELSSYELVSFARCRFGINLFYEEEGDDDSESDNEEDTANHENTTTEEEIAFKKEEQRQLILIKEQERKHHALLKFRREEKAWRARKQYETWRFMSIQSGRTIWPSWNEFAVQLIKNRHSQASASTNSNSKSAVLEDNGDSNKEKNTESIPQSTDRDGDTEMKSDESESKDASSTVAATGQTNGSSNQEAKDFALAQEIAKTVTEEPTPAITSRRSRRSAQSGADGGSTNLVFYGSQQSFSVQQLLESAERLIVQSWPRGMMLLELKRLLMDEGIGSEKTRSSGVNLYGNMVELKKVRAALGKLMFRLGKVDRILVNGNSDLVCWDMIKEEDGNNMLVTFIEVISPDVKSVPIKGELKDGNITSKDVDVVAEGIDPKIEKTASNTVKDVGTSTEDTGPTSDKVEDTIKDEIMTDNGDNVDIMAKGTDPKSEKVEDETSGEVDASTTKDKIMADNGDNDNTVAEGTEPKSDKTEGKTSQEVDASTTKDDIMVDNGDDDNNDTVTEGTDPKSKKAEGDSKKEVDSSSGGTGQSSAKAEDTVKVEIMNDNGDGDNHDIVTESTEPKSEKAEDETSGEVDASISKHEIMADNGDNDDTIGEGTDPKSKMAEGDAKKEIDSSSGGTSQTSGVAEDTNKGDVMADNGDNQAEAKGKGKGKSERIEEILSTTKETLVHDSSHHVNSTSIGDATPTSTDNIIRERKEMKILEKYMLSMHIIELRLREILLRHYTKSTNGGMGLQQISAPLLAIAADERQTDPDGMDRDYFFGTANDDVEGEVEENLDIEWITSPSHHLLNTIIYRPSVVNSDSVLHRDLNSQSCSWYKITSYCPSSPIERNSEGCNDTSTSVSTGDNTRDNTVVERRIRFRAVPHEAYGEDEEEYSEEDAIILTEGQVQAGINAAKFTESLSKQVKKSAPKHPFAGMEGLSYMLYPLKVDTPSGEGSPLRGIIVGHDIAEAAESSDVDMRVLVMLDDDEDGSSQVKPPVFWAKLAPDASSIHCLDSDASYRLEPQEFHPSSPAYEACETILTYLKAHAKIVPFLEPVDPVELNIPDYPEVVKHPMDISTVEKNLVDGKYGRLSSNSEYDSSTCNMLFGPFYDDLMLIFDNAMLYNLKGDWIHNDAKALKSLASKKIQTLGMKAEREAGSSSASGGRSRTRNQSVYVEVDSDEDMYEYESDYDDEFNDDGPKRRGKRKRSKSKGSKVEDFATRAIETPVRIPKALGPNIFSKLPISTEAGLFGLPIEWSCRRKPLEEGVECEESNTDDEKRNEKEREDLIILQMQFEQQNKPQNNNKRRSARSSVSLSVDDGKEPGLIGVNKALDKVQYFLDDDNWTSLIDGYEIPCIASDRTDIEKVRETLHEEFFAKLYYKYSSNNASKPVFVEAKNEDGYGLFTSGSFPPYFGRTVPSSYHPCRDSDVRWEIRPQYVLPALRWILRGLVLSGHLVEWEPASLESVEAEASVMTNHVYYQNKSFAPFEVLDVKEMQRRKRIGATEKEEEEEKETVELSAYEKMRAERVARNKERLKELGLA